MTNKTELLPNISKAKAQVLTTDGQMIEIFTDNVALSVAYDCKRAIQLLEIEGNGYTRYIPIYRVEEVRIYDTEESE